MAYARLGDLLVSAGLINKQQLAEALLSQKNSGKRLGDVLIDERYITEMQLAEALSTQLGFDYVDLSRVSIPAEMTKVIPRNLAKKYSVVPIQVKGDDLYLAMADPLNFIALEEVKKATKKNVFPLVATSSAVERTIAALYGSEGARRAIEDLKEEMADDEAIPGTKFAVSTLGEDDSTSAPAVRLINSIIERAITERASDIHLEPQEDEMVIRTRIDGLLYRLLSVPKDLQSAVIARVKVMCNMDVTERRIPQDGRAVVRVKMKEIDLRASTLPTLYGEKIVIRLLEKDSAILTPEGIGLSGNNKKKYEKIIQNHQGVILLAGPTGSGKSSTMYTMIDQLATEHVNLVTLEDPVEYDMSGVNQVQINEKVGMTFASGLKSILRQDPDIIAVGELRDQETADITMRAAITGHLVLATIHTNDAISTLARLDDLGVEPYMAANAMKGVISQRLVRRICPYCRKKYTPTPDELKDLGLQSKNAEKVSFYRGKGCPECFGTGYRGRIAVFEILIIDSRIREAIHENVSHSKLMDAVKASGFTSMQENCCKLVLQGVTTSDEAFRTLNATD